MQTARRVDDGADLSGLEGKGGLLKLLLHIALAKVAQVAALAGAAAVGLGLGQLAEGDEGQLTRQGTWFRSFERRRVIPVDETWEAPQGPHLPPPTSP